MADLQHNTPEGQAATPLVVSDDELARRAAGDRTAFAELYRRYLPRVYRYALAQLGNEQQAQDVTSQTFLAALEAISTFRGTGAFSAWLLGIARHKVTDAIRSRRAVAPLEEAAQVASCEPPPEDVVAARLDLERVARGLQALAPERAEALALRIFGGLTSAEAAAVLGKSEAAVKMLVHRGVQDLRERLAFRIEAEP